MTAESNALQEAAEKIRLAAPGHVIIFTDLDGSLLNHDDYSFAEAIPSLTAIKGLGIPLILCTSKTRREVEVIMASLGLDTPFIVENGGAIYFPESYREISDSEAFDWQGYQAVIFGTPYVGIRTFVEHIKGTYPLRGFQDMAPGEIADLCGFSLEQAELAQAREFSEPFVLEGKIDFEEFSFMAKVAGLKITRGGRFWHLVGEGNNKGAAVAQPIEIFSGQMPGKILSIALGDSINDLSMLEIVDIPVLIPHPDGSFQDIDLPHLIKAPFPGSRGWNSIVMDLIGNIKGNEEIKANL